MLLCTYIAQLVVKFSETAPAYSKRLISALAIVKKKVNKSCRATERLIQLAGKKPVKTAQPEGIRCF